MTDMVNEEEAGHLPLLSQSRHERMHEQYNNFQEEEDHWQDVRIWVCCKLNQWLRSSDMDAE